MIGAATHVMPSEFSSRSCEMPVALIRASSSASTAGLVMVYGVRATSGIAIVAAAASGVNANRALPTPVQYAGSRPPTRDATLVARWPRIRSR